MAEEGQRIVLGQISIPDRFPLHSVTDVFVGEKLTDKRIMGKMTRCTSLFPAYLLVDKLGNSMRYLDVPIILN